MGSGSDGYTIPILISWAASARAAVRRSGAPSRSRALSICLSTVLFEMLRSRAISFDR